MYLSIQACWRLVPNLAGCQLARVGGSIIQQSFTENAPKHFCDIDITPLDIASTRRLQGPPADRRNPKGFSWRAASLRSKVSPLQNVTVDSRKWAKLSDLGMQKGSGGCKSYPATRQYECQLLQSFLRTKWSWCNLWMLAGMAQNHWPSQTNDSKNQNCSKSMVPKKEITAHHLRVCRPTWNQVQRRSLRRSNHVWLKETEFSQLFVH